jgi:MFS family permease
VSEGASTNASWLELLGPGRTLRLLVLLGAVLLYAMSALLAVTVAPSAIREFGGVAYISWLTASFLASSITASTAGGVLSARVGARRAFIVAGIIFSMGALGCALATDMTLLIVGRFIQGAGGGLLSSLTYVLVRSSFPDRLWPRAFAAISGMWGIAVLFGPLIGGLFANAGIWRGAFVLAALASAGLAATASRVLEPDHHALERRAASFPLGQLSLMCLSIASVCVAQVCASRVAMLGLIVLAIAAFTLLLRWSRTQAGPTALFPRDAFSLHSVVGVGLWMALLLSIANDPFSIFGPLFLQELHGLSPLSAGYMVGLEAMSWTLAALTVAGFPSQRQRALLIMGPLIMGIGLMGIAWRMPGGTVMQLIVPIMCSGGGIGACWAFIAQRVMAAASAPDADVAASSVPTIQLYGFAFGGAVAGLVADVIGYSNGLTFEATRVAAFWVPASFVSITGAAALMGARLVALERAHRLRQHAE